MSRREFKEIGESMRKHFDMLAIGDEADKQARNRIESGLYLDLWEIRFLTVLIIGMPVFFVIGYCIGRFIE